MDASQGLNWTLIDQMAKAITPEARAAAEWRIRHGSKVSMTDFQVAIGVLFSIASLAFGGRLAIRLLSRRRVLLDDLLLIFSYLSLTASSAIFYRRARMFYLVMALERSDTVASLMAAQEIADIYGQLNWSFAYVFFLHTAIYFEKFCYLAFFHTLIRSMPRAIVRYYWVSVVLAVLCWVFASLQQLIACPYFGESSSRCFPDLPIPHSVFTFLFWFSTVIDGTTDATIISIPIIVLGKSQMSLATKFGYCVFLCLSLFMFACSITRAAGIFYQNAVDAAWGIFWLHAEACVGVLMASVTVYRSVLVGTTATPGLVLWANRLAKLREQQQTYRRPDSQPPVTARGRFGRFLLSKIPNAAFTSVLTFFGMGNNPDGVTTDNTNFSTQGTQSGYHDYLRGMEPGNQARAPDDALDTSGTAVSTAESKTQKLEREPSPPSRVPAVVLRFLFPRSQAPILQHRTIGTGRDGP